MRVLYEIRSLREYCFIIRRINVNKVKSAKGYREAPQDEKTYPRERPDIIA
jgi:hypothetical protein